ncbi:MAG TPA: hypothetical protein VKF40_04510 [Burkholderiales bacterium]|nr:hypothetical protein [Burkholderiales bacterium]
MNDIAAISGVSILLAVVFYSGSMARLRRKHRAEFPDLGGPSEFHDDTQMSSWLMADYMFRCRFMLQGDPVLTLLGTLWYLSMLLAIGLMVWEMVR